MTRFRSCETSAICYLIFGRFIKTCLLNLPSFNNKLRFITASLLLFTFRLRLGYYFIFFKGLLSYSSYNRSAEAVSFTDIPTAYWIITSITVILYYKNNILLNVSLHIFRNSVICGIYIQYVCKCQILVDFHPDSRTLRSLLFILTISGLLIFSPAKVSFITGTYICRTTDILMIN